MVFDLTFSGRLIGLLSGLSFHEIPHTASGWESFFAKGPLPLSPEHRKQLTAQAVQAQPKPYCIYEISLFQNLYITCFCDSTAETVYMLGPVLSQSFSEAELRTMLHRQELRGNTAEALLRYVRELPVLSQDKVYRLGVLLLESICGTAAPISHRSVDFLWKMPSLLPLVDTPPLPRDIREVENRYAFSKLLTEAVRQGNYALAVQVFQSHNPGTAFAPRSKNPLRNIQNLCIIANTQMRHALEESGIHPYKLDKLSSTIGFAVEQLTSVKEAEAFMQSILRQYCRLVQEYNYPDLPPLIQLAVTYIKDHLSENITVKDTAKALTVNANYLSGVFRREMGIGFIEFLNRERVRQAAGLLKHSNLQIQQIASLVGYNNTSYFDKQFFREYRQSPQQYRHQGPF